MRKNKKNSEISKDEMINISNKEQEILESYNEDFVEYNENINYEDETFDYKEEIQEEVKEEKKASKKEKSKEKNKVEEIESDKESETTIENLDDEEKEDNKETKKKKKTNYRMLTNIIFTLLLIILTMVAIDVISVARYERGPYFALPTKGYDDGGSKEYIGIGYKVIVYNQIYGRIGKEIGTYGLKYNVEPIEMEDIDIAIEFTDNEEEASYKKYYNKFVKIESKIESINFGKNQIKIGYKDEGGKYTLDIICNMASNPKELKNLNVGEKIYVVGTIKNYEFKTDKTPKKLIIDRCFAF